MDLQAQASDFNAGHEADMGVIVTALRRILRPIFRMMVSRVSCSFLVELVRAVFIEQARAHLERAGNGPVDSTALAELTGENVETIESFERLQAAMGVPGDDNDSAGGSRGRDLSAEKVDLRLDFCPESAVMDYWRNDPRFAESSGRPRVLPVFGPDPSFRTLVSRAFGGELDDATIGRLLVRLRDTGTVEIVDNSHVRVLHDWYVVRNYNERAGLESGSRALARLASNIEHNLSTGDNNRLFQRDYWSRRFRREDLDEVRRRCVVVSMKHDAEIMKIVEDFEQLDEEPGLVTYGVGCYHWQITDPRDP